MHDKKILASKITIDALSKNNSEVLSRRDAIKMLAFAGTASMMGIPPSLQAEESNNKSTKKVKILIVGAGTGGIIVMARLRSALVNADITIISPNELHIYQSGQLFMAAGLFTHDDIVKDNQDFIPDDVHWIKDEVASFNSDNNKVTTRSGKEVFYDYMVVATGVVNHYDWIDGLSEDDIGSNGISSVYLSNMEDGTTKGAEGTWQWFEALKIAAASAERQTVIYTHPNTFLKCGGASQKILYMSADHLKKDGLSANYIFATNSEKLFSIPEIETSLKKVQDNYESISNKFNHNLVSIDIKNKVATFEESYQTQGTYNEALEKYNMSEKKRKIDLKYDFIHIVPPMSPAQALIDSTLVWEEGNTKGWLEVDQYTLQHRRYDNIFGIGDVCGIPRGKTGGTARQQAPIVVANLVSHLEGKSLKEKFDGYTVCPFKTEYGEVLMVEFNYKGLAPTLAFLGPAQPRVFWWIFDLHILKPIYWHLMLRGWF